MIECVEGIAPQLQAEPVSERKESAERKINLSEAESRNVVSSFGSLAGRRWNGERGRIQGLSSGRVWIRNPDGLSRNQVGASVLSCKDRRSEVHVGVHRKSRAQ